MGKFKDKRREKKAAKKEKRAIRKESSGGGGRSEKPSRGQAGKNAKQWFGDFGKKIGNEAAGGLFGFMNSKTGGGIDQQINNSANTQISMLWAQHKVKVIIGAVVFFGGIVGAIVLGRKA